MWGWGRRWGGSLKVDWGELWSLGGRKAGRGGGEEVWGFKGVGGTLGVYGGGERLGPKGGRIGVLWGPRGAGLGGLGTWGLIWVEGIRFGVFGDLGGKFRVFWRCMGEEWLGSKGSRFGALWGLWRGFGVQGEQVWDVWGSGGRFGSKESDLGCLGTWEVNLGYFGGCMGEEWLGSKGNKFGAL